MRFSILYVTAAERITPRMVRVTLAGPGLADFVSVAPDQQCKLFFARPGQDQPWVPQMNAEGDVGRWYESYLAMPEAERPWMRSFTVRRHHPVRAEIDVDFVLHGTHGGPASRWAAAAEPGDAVGMLGPAAARFRTPADHNGWLLAGDETALPAIGALVESLPPGTPATVYVEVADAAEEQRWSTEADVAVHWLHRDGVPAGASSVLPDALRRAELRDGGQVFAWLAGEASTVRTLRRHLVNDRGIDKTSIAFTGYWRRRLTEDDPPTEEDTLDRAEAMAELEARRADG